MGANATSKRCRLSLIVLVALALSIYENSTVLAAPVDKVGVGNRAIGTYRRAFCPEHAVMTGAWTLLEPGWITSVQVFCAPVDATGAWTKQPHNNSSVMRQTPYSLDDNSIFSKIRKMSCGQDEYVTGFNPGQARITEGGSTRWVAWAHFIECRNSKTGVVTSSSYPLSGFNESKVMFGFDGINGARSCKAGEMGVGVWVTTSPSYLESLGLICAPRSDVTGVKPYLPVDVVTPKKMPRNVKDAPLR